VSTGVCVTVDRAMSQEQFLRPPIPLRRGPSMDDLMAEWKSLDVNAPKAQGRDQAGAQPGGQYEFAYAGGNGGNNMSYFNYPPVNTSVGSTGSVTGRVSGTAYGTGAGFNNNQLGAGAIVDVDSQQGGAHAERNSAAARGMLSLLTSGLLLAKHELCATPLRVRYDVKSFRVRRWGMPMF